MQQSKNFTVNYSCSNLEIFNEDDIAIGMIKSYLLNGLQKPYPFKKRSTNGLILLDFRRPLINF